MAVFAMEAASIISERSLEISFASALSTVSSSGVNVNAGKPFCDLPDILPYIVHVLRYGSVLPIQQWYGRQRRTKHPNSALLCSDSCCLFLHLLGGKGGDVGLTITDGCTKFMLPRLTT